MSPGDNKWQFNKLGYGIVTRHVRLISTSSGLVVRPRDRRSSGSRLCGSGGPEVGYLSFTVCGDVLCFVIQNPCMTSLLMTHRLLPRHETNHPQVLRYFHHAPGVPASGK
jgi:hypothetical protein